MDANTHVDIESLRTLIVCATRYALGRRSYIVSDVSRIVETYSHMLRHGDVNVLIRDIRQALDDNLAGDQCDRISWERLLERLTEIKDSSTR